MKHNLKTVDTTDCMAMIDWFYEFEAELRVVYDQRKKFKGGVIDKAIWLFIEEILGETR